MRHGLLDPATLAGLRDLGLVARAIVDGTMFGAHRSRLAGSGLEFSQYRSYQPGDDPRRVDWKLYARSDRHFVREAETETSLVVRLVVDATGSMAQADDVGGAPGAPPVSKLDYARWVAAALALVAHRQGDAVGLVTLADGAAARLEPRRDPRQLGRILHALEALRPAGRWPAWERIEAALLVGAEGGRRGLTVLVTDLHEHGGGEGAAGRDAGDEIRLAATRLAALRHDVLVIHLVGRTELALPYDGPVTFEELETGRRVEVDAARARAAYVAATAADLARVRRELEGRGIAYERIATDEPPDVAIARCLRERARRAGGPGGIAADPG